MLKFLLFLDLVESVKFYVKTLFVIGYFFIKKVNKICTFLDVFSKVFYRSKDSRKFKGF